MDKLVLCTTNLGKYVELKAMLPSTISLVTLSDAGIHVELPETGETLEANALQKARRAWAICGIPCLADDSGLEVDALDGAPGVRSARYAGEARDPRANMEKLLTALNEAPDRAARFLTVLALVDGNGEHLFHGQVAGQITRELRGSGGFGYDPVFVPEGGQRTFAEMTIPEKALISHRGRAMEAFLRHLQGRSSAKPASA
jgi:XTP/dITP diphosphohydrolase